jgi:hypothetical protein
VIPMLQLPAASPFSSIAGNGLEHESETATLVTWFGIEPS